MGGSEENLRINIEMLLNQKVWRVLGVPKPRYEFVIKGATRTIVKHYRLDALYSLNNI